MYSEGNNMPNVGYNGPDPSSIVELSIACRNLLDKDILSKSDPMVVVYEHNPDTNKWNEIGRTEIIWDNLNPVFAKKFLLTYHFERMQKFRFDVYDVDADTPNLKDHDFLGSTVASLGEIVSSGTLQKPLRMDNSGNQLGRQQNCGAIISVHAEEISSCKDEVRFIIEGTKLDKKDFFGSSDPYLEFIRNADDGSEVVVYRTPVLKRTLNPKWEPFTLQLRSLCHGDYQRKLTVRCFDWNRNGKARLIGEFNYDMDMLVKNRKRTFELIHPEKMHSKHKYKNSGLITFLSVEVEKVATFLDYVQGGLEMNCTFAIDFTASNGNPRQPGTLHYSSPYQPTQYAIALQAVGEIVQDYDSDNQFPAFGFGARIPPNAEVSHCFPLTLNPNDPACAGIVGVLNAYFAVLQRIELYGPTNFAPVINQVANEARRRQDGSVYHILLIITDGIITDMPQTKRAIVQAAVLPMSIIIVGVGTAEFDAMEELDGDDVRVSYNGQAAARDIVQFVPFRDFWEMMALGHVERAKRSLAECVLAEVPDQVVAFMRMRKIPPRPNQGRINRQRQGSILSAGGATLASVASSGYAPNAPMEPPPPYTLS